LSERLSGLKKPNEEIIETEVRDQTEDMVEVENHNSINKIDRKFNAIKNGTKSLKKRFQHNKDVLQKKTFHSNRS
jgi:flagellar biosynthesis/type III secretory pathway chaperone